MVARHARVSAAAIEDRRIGHATFRTLCCLLSFADKVGVCWPSGATLARCLGMDRSTVSGHLKALVALGYIAIEPVYHSDGGRRANRYRIRLSEGGRLSPRLVGAVGNSDGGVSDQPNTPVGPAEHTPVGISDIEHTIKEQTKRTRLAPGTARRHAKPCEAANHEFESFWQVYPSRGTHSNPKEPAQRKFEAAVESGVDPTEIICGADNYRRSEELNGTDPQFIPQAKTWLNQRRWKDHQEAPEPPPLRVGMN